MAACTKMPAAVKPRRRSSVRYRSCVQILGPHPSEAAFLGRLRDSDATKAVQIRRLLQMRPTDASSFSTDLKDGSGVSFVAQPIPGFIARPCKFQLLSFNITLIILSGSKNEINIFSGENVAV